MSLPANWTDSASSPLTERVSHLAEIRTPLRPSISRRFSSLGPNRRARVSSLSAGMWSCPGLSIEYSPRSRFSVQNRNLGFPDYGFDGGNDGLDNGFNLDSQGFLGERAGSAGTLQPNDKLAGFFLEADVLDVSPMGLQCRPDFFLNGFLDRFYGAHAGLFLLDFV